MIEIKDILLNISNVLLKADIKRETVRDVLNSVLGIEIKREDIQIKNNTIYLNIKPIYKNEIFLKKEEIREKLEKSLGKRHPEI
ncbi:MAG: hypothetical protein UU24_C0003G0012 [Candidatus Nomurabacteria bacterium GW2011_GWA2_40_9]|uniref:Uncharacterized protein n=1 Tax=Candidatus Nomurabacteria bacterium GW2011_GWA2_40_9 TaxID=1618734 RepID=A0A0G0WWG1_9BACT|nr:MAG: hypothetical protein UU24_C0003G0012 [Candidatus Nomurabacteria bacterium GW2011_GWA2_40_9]